MWYVYITKGRDGSLYTGMTKDVVRREKEHNTNNTLGAKSLRAKRPVHVVYKEQYETKSEAAKREYRIKKFQRLKKLELINNAHGYYH